MKKILLSITLSIALIAISSNILLAQKGFEGTIIYSIEYEDLPEEMNGMEAMLPKENILKIKGSKTRNEQSSAMGNTISIFDGKAKTGLTLMDMMGTKVAIKTPKEDIKKAEEEKSPEITYLDETKEIAGYKCKKAEIKYNDEEAVTVYYTEEISTQSAKSEFKGLKGFPMAYEISAEGMKMVMTVKEVKKEKISDGEFTIPKDYEVMTVEEFQQMMSGGMMGE